jgi:hypothetical protein
LSDRSVRPAAFIASSFLFLAGSISGYFGAVDTLAIPRTAFGKQYRQFLLSASDGIEGRIIIESGSNSVYGIDAKQLEKHFGRLTIVISDNAGYPLRHKIFRLRRHLHASDTVILPLEWLQYRTERKLPQDYVASIVDAEGSNAFYYRELPLIERLVFVMRDLPFSAAIASAYSLHALPRWNPTLRDGQAASLARFRTALRQSDRGDRMILDHDVPMEALTSSLPCDYFLFGLFEQPGISETFLDNLDLLARLRDETQARIFFAWPAVVARDANECYGPLSEFIDGFAQQIESHVTRRGFSFLGRKEQSRFDHRCMRDTYYHLRPECAAARTRLLIESIEEVGAIEKLERTDLDFDAVLERYLSSLTSPAS